MAAHCKDDNCRHYQYTIAEASHNYCTIAFVNIRLYAWAKTKHQALKMYTFTCVWFLPYQILHRLLELIFLPIQYTIIWKLSSFHTKFCYYRGCTYRDMCELNKDECYQHVWRDGRESATLEERSSLLRHNRELGLPDATSSDSGRSSGGSRYHLTAANSERTTPLSSAFCLVNANNEKITPRSSPFRTVNPNNERTTPRSSPFHVVSVDLEKATSVRGYLTTLLQDQRAGTGGSKGNGILFEAPEEFRSPSEGSRSPSPTNSIDSNSNTSDYGSNVADEMKLNKSPASTLIVINSRHHNPIPVDSLDEAASRRAFTTFHSDRT